MAASRARPQPRARLRRNPLLLTLLAGGTLAVVLVVASVLSARAPSRAGDAALAGVGEAVAVADGIPQHGLTLGSPQAPVTIEEYADLQCPYCRVFALDALPPLVQRYVRTGKAKLVFRPLAFIGDDSVSAALLAVAAGKQDRLWQLVDLLYRNQGAENSGWVSPSLLRGAALAVGLDADAADADAARDAAAAVLDAAQARATTLGVTSTPTLVVVRSGRPLQVLTDVTDPTRLLASLAAALA